MSATGRTLAPARPGLTPARPANEALFDRERAAQATPNRSAIDQDYQNQRTQLEQRHVQEYANPRGNESGAQMFQRQEFEHNELQARYNYGRSTGMSHMPESHFGGGGFHGGGGGRPR
jgi:hypothetical protein